jgi:hypothetical protein
MQNMNGKWWVALVVFLGLAPATFAVQDHNNIRRGDPINYWRGGPIRHENPQSLPVPEGGSSLVYVLGAGVTCLGAMLVRSRVAKPKES